jgi:iron complex outermembrane recepter protein
MRQPGFDCPSIPGARGLRLRLTLLALASAAALLPARVCAQSTAPTSPPAAEEAQTITITSVRKKLESVRDVPATVSVLSGADLQAAGVVDVRGIEYKIPGLVLGDKGFDGASIGIRGASSIRGFTGDEAAVAVHLDGIYIPQSGQALGRLFDVARVETLFGPQGSLYGRNAVAGVIDIVSNAPEAKFGGNARLSLGSRSAKALEGVLNVPIDPTSGLRLAVSGVKSDGYIQNILDGRKFNDEDFSAGRLRYKGVFGNVTADLTFQGSVDNRMPGTVPGRPNNPAANTQGVGWGQTAVDTDMRAQRKDSNLALKFDVELGSLTLRSITGYNTYRFDQKVDTVLTASGTPSGASSLLFQDSKAWSQEFNLLSSGDNVVDWRLGVYFTGTKVVETRFQDDTLSPFADGFTGYDDFRLKQDGSARAIFGTVDWKLSQAVTASLGLRYNHETKDQLQDETWGIATPTGAIPNCAATGAGALFCNGRDQQKFSWSGPAGDLTLKWQASKDVQTYLRAARGFRSGAVGGVIGLDNGIDQLFGGPGTFTLKKLKPETLDSVELGAKASLMGGRVQLNAALFHNVFKDMLVFTSDPVTFRLIEGNVGKSVTTGLDLAASADVTRNLRIEAAISYLDSEITDVGNIASGARVGNKPIYAPRLSSSLGVSYRMTLAGGRLALGVEANHKDQLFFNLANTQGQGAVDLVNLNASWEAPTGRWRIFGAVNNATDERYYTGGGLLPASNPPGPGLATIGEPRTYRLGVGLTF